MRPPLLCRLHGCLLQRPDVLNDRLGPAIDVRPLAVAHAVLVRRHVDHVPVSLRLRNRVMRLFVGDNDQAVVAVFRLVCRRVVNPRTPWRDIRNRYRQLTLD